MLKREIRGAVNAKPESVVPPREHYDWASSQRNELTPRKRADRQDGCGTYSASEKQARQAAGLKMAESDQKRR